MALGDLWEGLRERWLAVPWWLRLAGVAVAGYGGLRLMGQAGPLRLDERAIRDLPRMRSGTEAKLEVAGWLADELYRDGTLTLDEIAALLLMGYWETAFRPSLRSAHGAPDDRVGGSWGVIQLAATTLEWLGYSVDDVTARDESRAERERATRGSARAAVAALVQPRPAWADRRSYLAAIRESHREDPVGLAREIAVRWQAGAGRQWADVLGWRPDPTIGSGGWLHFAIPMRLQRLPAFRRALRLEPLDHETTAWIATTAWAERERWGVRDRE